MTENDTRDAAGGAIDLQGLFEAQATRNGDFLTAGKVEDIIGLCLSGGGYRAMLYHVGALIRLNELGLLSRVREIASVSGGSITAAVLGRAWPNLQFDSYGQAVNLTELVVLPLTHFATVAVDVRAILLGFLPGFTAAGEIAKAYDRHLFAGATLQDLPDAPRFTFMATNLQTGSGWRFGKDYAADHRVGRIDRPYLALSQVVAASSAFPPFLSPVRVNFKPGSVQPMKGADLHKPPFTDQAVLTDGGVYDNLGLERIWRRCRTIFVSNAGATIPEIGSPTGRWIGQAHRVLRILQQQAESSRKRLLFGVNNLKQRNVAFWSIETPLDAYRLADAVRLPSDAASRAANIRTRLNPFSPKEIELLLHVGYAGADASLRSRGFAANVPAADVSRLTLHNLGQCKSG
jgi:NTE family protein